jgi:hypothetical protein
MPRSRFFDRFRTGLAYVSTIIEAAVARMKNIAASPIAVSNAWDPSMSPPSYLIFRKRLPSRHRDRELRNFELVNISVV